MYAPPTHTHMKFNIGFRVIRRRTNILVTVTASSSSRPQDKPFEDATRNARLKTAKIRVLSGYHGASNWMSSAKDDDKRYT